MTTTADTLTENAHVILCKRYLSRALGKRTCARCGEVHETVDAFFDRVSLGRADYREMLSSLVFLPNSPTLFNLGVPGGGTLSACFKFDVADELHNGVDGIMDVATKAALVLKSGGGVGYAFSALRPEGALVRSTHGSALGPVGVLRIYNELAMRLTQGGKRDAAQMGILHVEHPDVRKFIHVKDEDPDRLATFNISVAVTDAFMVTAASDPESDEGVLLAEVAQSAWLTGDPGLYFIDAAERGNPTPWLGQLTGTNPCGEVPLLNDEPCNLGSHNLGRYVVGRERFDESALRDRVRLAVDYLDDVLDANTFPDPAIDRAARLTRKLGMGVCGAADALALMGVPYDSTDATGWAHDTALLIQRVARERSLELAAAKGPAPAYLEPHDCADGHPHPRNATVTCIAPTGTIAILMGASSGIEPHFALANTREMGDGTILDEAVDFGGFTPKTAHEIDHRWHIAHQAAWQDSTDLAVSKTINMPHEADATAVLASFIDMWERGCKGGTIFRDGSRERQVLRAVTEPGRNRVAADGSVHAVEVGGQVFPIQHRHKLPDERPSRTRKFRVGEQEGYMTVGLYEDGSPGELFLRLAKQGSEISMLYDVVGILTSIGLQHGVDIDILSEKLSHIRSDPSGLTADPDIPTASSVIDYIFRRMGMDYGALEAQQLAATGMACPDCSGPLVAAEGCLKCLAPGCGYSRC